MRRRASLDCVESENASRVPLKRILHRELQLTGETARRLNEFFGSFASAGPLLLLDYDGTLAAIPRRPFQSAAMGRCPRIAGAHPKSGPNADGRCYRPAGAEIVPLLGWIRLPEMGVCTAPSACTRMAGVKSSSPARNSRQTRRDSARSFGRTRRRAVEEKPNALVMHWRGVSPRKAKLIEASGRAICLSRWRTWMAWHCSSSKPAWNCARAATRVRSSSASGETKDGGKHPAAYLGDDITDEAAFRAIKGHGLGALVKRQYRDTAASVWLRPPEDLKEFLKRWLQACSALESE